MDGFEDVLGFYCKYSSPRMAKALRLPNITSVAQFRRQYNWIHSVWLKYCDPDLDLTDDAVNDRVVEALGKAGLDTEEDYE